MPKNSKLVSGDTEILIWGIQKKANPAERKKEKIPKAEYIFSEYIQKEGLKLVIPTIVAGEYLIKLTQNEKDVFFEFLEKCLLVDYDFRAAIIAAEIWSKKNNIKGQRSGTRHCINADCKIIATAKAHGASVIYTEHDDIIKLAKLINFPTKSLPDKPPEQMNLL